jgi:dienelactone hydrolase
LSRPANLRKFARCWALGALLLAAPMVYAQQGSKVHMHGDGGYAADGFLWEPGNGNGGAVLLIPDAKGLTAYVRDEAQRLYTRGFVIIAVDLARGQPRGDAAATAPTGQGENGAVHDLKAALNFLRAQPNVRAGAVGLEGWGTGGSYALQLAALEPGIRAVAVTLAQSPDSAALTAVHCALLVNLPRTTDLRVRSLAQKPGWDFKIYSDADPDFFDPENPSAFRAEDADDARRRTEDFFGRELAPNAATPAAPSL